ncbi:MAG TPA: universal stress protein [Usitatibacter sp.]|nr:universal stress protein [Usitatibacter sp.]
MKKLLIPVDGTAQSLEAVRNAVREGPSAIQRVDLLNVQPLFNRHVSAWVGRSQRDAWRAERAAAALAPASKLLESLGIAFRTHVATGNIAQAIATTARELRSDEIVMGSARHSLWGRLLTNSASARLLELSPVPVRIIPGAPASRYERLAFPAGLGLIALLFLADE